MVVRDLYGINSTGSSFGNHLDDCMKNMEYMSCPADPDLWTKPMARQSDGAEYYAYILLYVDDILCICHNAESVLTKLKSVLS